MVEMKNKVSVQFRLFRNGKAGCFDSCAFSAIAQSRRRRGAGFLMIAHLQDGVCAALVEAATIAGFGNGVLARARGAIPFRSQ
jgi:hypothetical protein